MTSKTLRHLLATALVALSAAFAMSATPSFAANRTPNVYIQGVANATAGQTFATTSYADLAASSITVVPARDPNQTGLTPPGVPTDYLQVSWSADVSKATATVGTCAIFVNGAVLAASARSAASAGGQDAIGGTFLIPNTTTGSQTVKLQCKSGDTNIFTVSNAQLSVIELL